MSKRVFTEEQRERNKIRRSNWYQKNKERAKRLALEWCRRNPEKRKAVRRKCAAKYHDKYLEAAKARNMSKRRAAGIPPRILYHRTKEQQAVINRELASRFYYPNPSVVKARAKIWKRSHPESASKLESRRRNRVRKQLHPDRNDAAIHALHLRSKRLTEQTGVTWVVDHIIPIYHGGWEHELNMQLLPFLVNSSKGKNPFWHHALYKSWRDVPEFLWPDKLAADYRKIFDGVLHSNAVA